ncbi:MAG: tRNA 2-thiouridine(34) synthase MnmA, partial [Simkania negevensis]|nr:tRNA 2-thiouridine(34) synthase MnmA [Simkania negevensis]
MKVAIAMSGGVDSATSAYLLKEQGYDIFALFMKNWEEKDREGECLSKKDYEDMVATCETLKIPYYVVNFSKEYWEQVFIRFIEEIKAGFTPNPDILCNKEIKFHALLNKALSLGADCLATGHYAQTKEGSLFKGKDPEKDQSYFLYTLKEEILKKSLFPVGALLKKEVREIAKKKVLPVHGKKDSTGICFIGERNFKPFLENYIPRKEGEIRTIEGETVGKHQGIYFYTIGQRKGIGLGGPGEPYFVVDKDPKKNLLLVARGKNHPALFAKELTATEATWIKEPPSVFPFK